ncbi:S1C family serine protease [Mucilaginibacter aquariorum]|uniref:S1C family serine protease n=1 Tax=Mucilaginibacter aquariorum TaxID=2967225 RepID=A0ABT1T2E0_9SPHI|nr:trypsin-like peptidase domain-containing protein [Mucilaginibacter aquariorum]MCQ6958722.1 S1C family serine protease [Mucilaginibacter aquariorum]
MSDGDHVHTDLVSSYKKNVRLSFRKKPIMKNLLIYGLLLLPAILKAQVPTDNGLSAAVTRALPAVVVVQSFLSDSILAVRPQSPLVKNLPTAATETGKLIASASGVVLSADGYVMTNAHVLAGGDSLNVILPNRRSYRAVLVGTDDQADLALLKIAASGLAFIERGDPGLLGIGDQVLAIGNPLELTSTVTAGILSARYRSIDDNLTLSTVNSFLQTDAAINEGMSGSALLNRQGQLIGMNAAIISPSGTFAGYSFAIPAQLVYKAYHDLLRYTHVRHGCLEGSFSDLNDAQARRLGTSTANGVLVESVLKSGAGYQAGLRKNDVITAVDRQPVYFAAQLREIIAIRDPGEQLELTVEHSGKVTVITAVLSENRDRRDLAGRQHAPNVKQVQH